MQQAVAKLAGGDASAGKKKGNNISEMDDNLRPEYDLSKLEGGVKGKYASKYQEGTNLILLEPDVAEVFKDNQSVNEALRLLIKIAGEKHAKQDRPVPTSNSNHSVR